MSEPTLKLPRGADQLLQSFPANEPDFEAQAKEIEARLATGVANAGITFDGLLAPPPLDAELGEPAARSEVRAAPAPKTSFAEMARKSLHKKDDSAELKELLAATAQSRRPSAEMVERVRAAGRATAGASATGTPVPSSSREPTAEEAARPSGVVARAQPTPRAPATAANQRGTIIGIAGVAVGIAACVALFLKPSTTESPASSALAAEKAAQAAAVAQAAPAAAAPVTKSDEGVTTPEELAAAPRAVAAHEMSKSASKSAATVGSPSAVGKGSATPSGGKPEAVVLEDDPPPVAPIAASEPKPEPAAPEPPLKPAQGASGDVPLTPSAGAVSTALSSVRGGAQACLAGQSDAVTAVVTFASDGHVQRVSAGGASGACIQAALSKARIAPFARDSFSATTTIRPP
jgi:hypothetical protein